MREFFHFTWIGFRNFVLTAIVVWCLATPISVGFLIVGWDSNDDFHRCIFTLVTLLGFVGFCYLMGAYFGGEADEAAPVRKQPWEV